jgi:hypothetical protein
MPYHYKSENAQTVAVVREYMASKKKLVKAANDFSKKHSMGNPGFGRSVFDGNFLCGGVSMSKSQWDKEHRELWYCPKNGFSTPRPPKKGEEPSEVYSDFEMIKEMEVSGVAISKNLGLRGLTQPGFFIYNDCAFFVTGEQVTVPGMVEVTTSEYEAAKEEHEELPHA